MSESRVHKSLLNAKVNLLFYFLSLLFAFFSRKIFLTCLGAEFIGLSGTLGNILGFLNLAELGISSSISYFLFKPLQTGNRDEIKRIISVCGYLYQWIGLIILGGGAVVSLSFPFVFRNSGMEYLLIYVVFYSYLCSSLLGYFLNYRQIVLSADQRSYVVTVYFQSASLVKTLMQLLLAYYLKNCYVWISIELVFSFIASWILNWKINKVYPWLKVDIRLGRKSLKEFPEIMVKTRQIFVHRIKDFILGRCDEFLIFLFVSLKMVAYYGNYTMIIGKLITMFAIVLDSPSAGIGNMVAEGDKQKIIKVFWELQSTRYLMAGLTIFSLAWLLPPFITLWLGSEYILSDTILFLMLFHSFIMQTRPTIDRFNMAYGQFADTWSAWTEAILNLGVTLLAASHYGLIGILLGKCVSTGTIIVFWKPYYLFHGGFKLPYRLYWKGVARYLIIIVLSAGAIWLVSPYIPFNPYKDIGEFIGFSICSVGSYSILLVLGMYWFAPGIKDLVYRIPFARKIGLHR